ncbi:MAG: hypothetical protein M1481_05440 [Candidatus Thermoplasmatota archaeon]|nr:hypothetical protein [Candidatus Thermoplasmatota archaeon]MCL5963656.1 hypothetical protein [Candidatus Thermoplasmatota archaeon]
MVFMMRAEEWVGGKSFLMILNKATDEVCDYLKLDKDMPNFQTRLYRNFNFSGMGFGAIPTYEVVKEPIVNELIHSQFKQLSQLPSVKSLIETIGKFRRILEVNQEPEKLQKPPIPDNFEEWTVWYLLVYTLKERYSSNYDNTIGKRFISYVESYIRKEPIRFNVGIYLEFFDIPGEDFVELSPVFFLRRLTSEERS